MLIESRTLLPSVNRYEAQYKVLLERILYQRGILRQTRTGDTMALFNQQLTVSYEQGFPLITGRKLFIKNIVAEFQWMLSGSTNVKFLQEKGVDIWNQWADEAGDLGPTYGYQLSRQWDRIVTSLKNNPYSRRHIIDLWQFNHIDAMALPPCYYSFQFIVVKGNLNLTVVFRSSDAAVGLPYDVGVLSLFLYEMSLQTGYPVGELTCILTDVHVNVENIDAVKEYIDRPAYALPTLEYTSSFKLQFSGYSSEPHIKMTIKP
jgi:thymidylate synthase